jgi:hypothetical protein
MRNRVTALSVSVALSTLSLAGGCALRSSSPMPLSAASQSFDTTSAAQPNATLPNVTLPKSLFVTDGTHHKIEVLANGTWKDIGYFAEGSYPWGDWVDKLGNIYITNAKPGGPSSILEYGNTGPKHPIFSYSEGMRSPVSVTTDENDNVYEADFTGYVIEYAQKRQNVKYKCAIGSGLVATGVAVGNSGHVFVDYSTIANAYGGIVEYKTGLLGCHQTHLGPKLADPYGIVFDAHGNLVVADAATGKVHIIAPPYDKITTTWGATYHMPIHLTLDLSNKLAFVTEAGVDVLVVAYPRGGLVARLGPKNGLGAPYDAVDGENSTP